MPIRPSQRHRYPSDWPRIRAAILTRASQRCEQCGVLNGSVIWKHDRSRAFGQVLDMVQAKAQHAGYSWGGALKAHGLTRIVLTIAHLDHQPENCDPANLRALCQRCHLAHDKEHHRATAQATRRARRALGDLFEST